MRGGRREGAGRPVGWRKENPCQRTRRQLVAFDDEWALIDKFAKFVKFGDKTICEKYLKEIEDLNSV